MLSPASLAVLQRLIAILLALVDALDAQAAGAPRPLATRLATGAFSASVKRLVAHLTEMADQIPADPAPPPHPTRTRVSQTPPAPPIIRSPSPPPPQANPLHIKIKLLAPQPAHAHLITISKLKSS